MDNESIYLKEISDYPLLSAEEELALGKLAAEGTDEEKDAAKDRFTKSNLRLVVSFARKYLGRGLSLQDLIQEGNIGLIQAIEHYDYTKGLRFSTYAAFWIKKAISEALMSQTRVIHIPKHQAEAINKVLKAQKELAVRLSHEPSVDEIAAETGFPASRISNYLELEKNLLSMDASINAEDDSTLSDMVSDESSPSPEEELEADFLRDELMQALERLNEREKRIIALRYGLEDGRIHTLEEVAGEFLLTKERVRQIENNALRKLRHPLHSGNLKEYL